jgi:hypothetical protein
MKLIRHRIVKDIYSGYECQVWRIWFPFWVQMNFVNTHSTIENAKTFIKDKIWKVEV